MFKLALIVSCIILFQFSFAQKTILLKGYVKDSDNGPIAGATVVISKTYKKTITNVNGYYELSILSDLTHPIIYACPGFKKRTIAYHGQKILNVQLENEVTTLKEVQITAKSNINAVDVRTKTGNVEVITGDKIKNITESNIALALQGKIPGLQIINKGELGTMPQIRIRGNSSLRKGDEANQPLYILDGKMISAETFFYLNPEDIKEMKVLKDAVALALYGIKAANGVIEMSSKKGGKKAFIYHAQTGLTLAPPLRVKLMNSSEKLELERRLKNSVAPGYLYSKDYILRKYGGTPLYPIKLREGQRILDSLRNINTNWYKELVHTRSYQKHDINFRNSSEKMSYLLSLGYFHQGGELEGNDFSRISSRFNLDQGIAKNAIATFSFSGTYAKTRTPHGTQFSPESLIYQLNPYETKRSKKLYSYPHRSYNDLFNQFSKESTNKNLGFSLSMNYKASSRLEISAVSGLDFSLIEWMSIIPKTAFSETSTGYPINSLGTLHQFKGTVSNLTSNIRFNYNNVWGKHEVTMGANADNYTTTIDNLYVEGHGLDENIRSVVAIDNDLEGAKKSIVSGSKQTNRNLGFGTLLGYTYDAAYNMFATYKLDASSVLPTSKRWNAAWALGASVNMKSYHFLQRVPWLSELDIRGSYGCTANAQGISPAVSQATFYRSRKSYDQIRSLEIMALPNKNLKAEQNRILDIGLSAGLKKTNFTLSAYRRTTYNALLNVSIATSSGFSSQLQNVGVLQNQGIELTVNQQFFSSKNWNFRLGGNMSYNENKVFDLYGKQRVYDTSEDILPTYEVGKSTDVLYGLKSTGINPITGLPEFINHEGKQVEANYSMKREDFVCLGKSTSPINGGIFCNIGYKRLTIEMDFYYSLGGVRSYSSKYIRDHDNAIFNAAKAQLTDMWWAPGDDKKKYPIPFQNSSVLYNLSYPTNKTVMKTDFIRFQNLSIKYQFNAKLHRMTLGINASNLAMLSNYKSSDPETSNLINPLPPTIALNLNVTF